jgi:hypothetical protein
VVPVSITDSQDRRHRVEVIASSTFHVAHLCLTHAKEHPDARLSIPTRETAFEIATAGKIYMVYGSSALERRQTLNGRKASSSDSGRNSINGI